MKPAPPDARNRRVSNPRQRKQQHLLDVKLRESKERARRWQRVSGWIFKVILIGGLAGAIWFGGKEALRNFVWENPDYFLREINVATDGALTREQVLNAADLVEGRNIFTVDLAETRSAIEKMAQVESAIVQRQLPNRMSVIISERRPIAWVAAKGDEDPSSSERSFLIDARGIVLRSRVVLPEYYHLPIISGFETENLVPGKRVPAWEMQAALELIRLNADNTRCQVRNINLAKGYCLVVLDQKRTQITFGLDDIEKQLARLERYLERAEEEAREIQTINLLVERNVPVTFRVSDPVDDPDAVSTTAAPAKSAAADGKEKDAVKKKWVESSKKPAVPTARALPVTSKSRGSSTSTQFQKKPFRQNP